MFLLGTINMIEPKVCMNANRKEKFKDTKGVIRSRKSKDRQYNDQKKK
jgi:hypothetical protein